MSSINEIPDIVKTASNEHLHFKVVDHLYTYPLVQQTNAFVSKLPVTRIAAANVKPILESKIVSAPLNLIKPVSDVVDNLAVKSLVTLEKVIPSLKTKTYQKLGEEVMLPYNFTKNTINKGVSEVTDLTTTYAYDPVHNNIIKFRKFYNEKIYDTKGKPLIRGSLDSFVAPINKKVEDVIKSYLPDGPEVSSEGFSNEIDRSFALLTNAVSRAGPVTEKKASEVIMAPCNYTSHVIDIFNTNLDKEESLSIKNSFNATKTSVVELEKEIVAYIKEHAAPFYKKSVTTVSNEVAA
jgi:sporulation-specific protein 4